MLVSKAMWSGFESWCSCQMRKQFPFRYDVRPATEAERFTLQSTSDLPLFTFMVPDAGFGEIMALKTSILGDVAVQYVNRPIVRRDIVESLLDDN